jgi:hypothetical protein
MIQHALHPQALRSATGIVGETRRNLQPWVNDEVRAPKSPGAPNSTNWKRTISVWATEHNDTGLFAGAVKGPSGEP